MRPRDVMTENVVTVTPATTAKDAADPLPQIYSGPGRWTVDVVGGAVAIRDAFDSDTDLHVATVLTEAVPGVVVVHVDTRRVP